MTAASDGQQALDLLRRIAEALERNNDLVDRQYRLFSTGSIVAAQQANMDWKSREMREMLDKMPVAKTEKEKK